MIKINIINRQLTLFFLFVVNISPSFRKGQITGVTSYHTQAVMESNGNIPAAQKDYKPISPSPRGHTLIVHEGWRWITVGFTRRY